MPSIINGLFAGRSGIASHGNAIAVVGDNISNASTVGFKASRSEFEDLIAGGQTAGKVVGSGSQTSAVTALFQQGTVEFTGRELDLAIDGNGLFVVANGAQRFYTRAGNFKIDDSGFLVDQQGFRVLGFPNGGTGGLEPINFNTVSQDNVSTTSMTVTGNLDARAEVRAIPGGIDLPGAGSAGQTNPGYGDLNPDFQTSVEVFDSLGQSHTLSLFFYKTGANQFTAHVYANSNEIIGDNQAGAYPRLVATEVLTFNSSGALTSDGLVTTGAIAWNNGSTPSTINVDLSNFTQFSAPDEVRSITQDGKGVGSVGSFSIEKDGTIFALLSNGQSSSIGKIGLVNFANPEGLARIGKNLLQQTPTSGAPVVGEPGAGSFGQISSGSLELSNVDIANEFVKLITLQRGFQANSRIITTINQLLNDIIQLA